MSAAGLWESHVGAPSKRTTTHQIWGILAEGGLGETVSQNCFTVECFLVGKKNSWLVVSHLLGKTSTTRSGCLSGRSMPSTKASMMDLVPGIPLCWTLTFKNRTPFGSPFASPLNSQFTLKTNKTRARGPMVWCNWSFWLRIVELRYSRSLYPCQRSK